MNLLDLAPSDAATALAAWMSEQGEPRYRTPQALRRLWRQPARAWHDATELPLALRNALERKFPLRRPRLVTRQVSSDGTIKFLWGFPDDEAVEAVLIPEGRRKTLCISSQVGCAYGCIFCATGRMGFGRHLEAWEITAQLRELLLDDTYERPTNVVFMGMGEPLHNWDNVDRALTILNDPQGLGLGARHITVSTIGLVPALAKLAARPEQFRLALSLHGADSDTRRRLMPIEKKYPLASVVKALGNFRRRITLEYVLIADINDQPEHADRLANLARPLRAHVNLLPLHPGGAPDLHPSSEARMRRFADRLLELGVRATLRRSRGLDISAACGQLRLETDRHGIRAQDHGHVQQPRGIGIKGNDPIA